MHIPRGIQFVCISNVRYGRLLSYHHENCYGQDSHAAFYYISQSGRDRHLVMRAQLHTVEIQPKISHPLIFGEAAESDK